jgi:hypothetical protein
MVGARTAARPGFSAIPKVRHEPPTMAEAVAVARDLADGLEHQVGIVAGLMGISGEQAAAGLAGAAEGRTIRPAPIRSGGLAPARTALVVERKTSRSKALRPDARRTAL